MVSSISAAVATSREGHRWPGLGPAVRLRRWGQELLGNRESRRFKHGHLCQIDGYSRLPVGGAKTPRDLPHVFSLTFDGSRRTTVIPSVRQSRDRTSTRTRGTSRWTNASNSPGFKATSKTESAGPRDHYPPLRSGACRGRSTDVVCLRTRSTAICGIRSLDSPSITSRPWQSFRYPLSVPPPFSMALRLHRVAIG
jgi:hypothetical protein